MFPTCDSGSIGKDDTFAGAQSYALENALEEIPMARAKRT
jgi:hypothetical protein